MEMDAMELFLLRPLEVVEIQVVAGQLNDAFLSSESFHGGKTQTYLDQYCSGDWFNDKGDASELLMPCMDLIYVYSKTYILRNALFTKFIALFRSSPLKSLTESNLEVSIIY